MTLLSALMFALASQTPLASVPPTTNASIAAPSLSAAPRTSAPRFVEMDDLATFQRQYWRSLGSGAAAAGIGIGLGALAMRGSQGDFDGLLGGVIGGMVAFPLGCAYGAATTDSLMEARGSAMIAALGAVAGIYAGAGLTAGSGGILFPCVFLLPPLGATLVQRFSVSRSLRIHPVLEMNGGAGVLMEYKLP